jgi:hypothetical protein
MGTLRVNRRLFRRLWGEICPSHRTCVISNSIYELMNQFNQSGQLYLKFILTRPKRRV